MQYAEGMLKDAGFVLSDICCSRPSCFDFAVRKNKNIVFIKFQSNVGYVTSNDAYELKLISECVSANSLLVSERTRERPLEDDTVYTRYNLLTVTPKTFENIVVQKIHPMIHAGPGGYYVETDGEAVKQRRQELGLSVGDMAEMIGTSRRTLYGYERGMAKASVSAAYNLIWILGIPVAKPINVFKKSQDQHRCLLTKAKYAIAKNKLLKRILKKLCRYHVTAVKKAPFDFFVTVPHDEMKIIGGVVSKMEPELDRRVDEILSLSRIIEAHPILVTSGQKPSGKDISCISSRELSKVRYPEDLIVTAR
jgi:putative transcriptional regulator